IGESEKSISRLFASAKRNSPCVVFMDEIEALFSSRESTGDFGRKVRCRTLFAQLILEIDSLSWESAQVVLLAATNHPEALDASLLRPGTLDRLIAVPPPSVAERRAILVVLQAQTKFADDVDLDWVAERTEGKTGADLKDIVRRA
ncbi:P-loop containing nucleoside triphosphate hydrolase protein, partial [Blyttiomyces helicus]